ncbi:MAG TPA: hypothetical protein VFG71_04810 [Nitrospiraceae bacterium]|nr:hypothetical protein [Nitrospiraceae bacterium]
MKLANERNIGVATPLPPQLEAVITRLERLSFAPQFSVQRDVALGRALQTYLSASVPLAPLTEEVRLSELFLYADFYPEDGQLTLIEQLRDVITEHIPEEERCWLDPLKHSYMDLVEILPARGSVPVLMLRSLGNGRAYRVQLDSPALAAHAGQVLLTRLVRPPGDPETEEATIAGSALVLSAEDANAIYEATGEYRREMEITGGSFELGDWPEFAKRFGHILLWNFARLRMAALVDAVVSIHYVTGDNEPYLYTIALYEHCEFTHLRDSLSDLNGFRPRQATGSATATELDRSAQAWTMAASGESADSRIVARLTLTATQLMVECDSRERLNTVKHALAAAYGFSLHFRGETIAPPKRQVTADELASDQPLTIRITPEADRALLNTFLETTYLEWADQESPALGGETPRHAAASEAGREKVAAVITGMEREDLGLRRTGIRAFDYNKLRAHVGLEEVAGG